MAGLPNNRTPRVGPWPQGINNLADERSLPRDQFGTRPVALREAENIDLSRDGKPSRRGGYTEVLQGNMSHSGWSAPGLRHGFFVDSGRLYAFDGSTATDLGVDVGNKPLSYSMVDSLVLFSNADACGVIDRNLQVRPWAVPAPAGAPRLRAVSGFSMDPGQYLVGIAYIDDMGRESPMSPVASIEVDGEQGIEITIDPSLDGFYVAVVYTSEANDQILRRGRSFPATAGITEVLSFPANGMANTDRVLAVLPPGQITRYASGRHWVALGEMLIWSVPLRPGVFDPELSFIRMDSPITMVEFVGAGTGSAGLYIGTEREIFWLDGADPGQARRVDAYPFGAVRGTALYVPAKSLGQDGTEDVLVFMTRDGQYCIGGGGGVVTPLHEDRTAMDLATEGASVYIDRNGMKQVVTSLKGARPNGMATTDKAVAHVIHSEV